MNKLPLELRRKLKELHAASVTARELNWEVGNILDSYGLDIDLFMANCEYEEGYVTEALACIINAEGNLESSIDEIEVVFLNNIKRNANNEAK